MRQEQVRIFDTTLRDGEQAPGFSLRPAEKMLLARQLDLLGRSRCDANWKIAATRLKSIAASFGALGMIALADEALQGAPGDPVVLRKITFAIDEFAGS